MEKRTTYYVSRKNVLTWLSAIFMLCSVVARMAAVFEKGEELGCTTVWFQIVLPVLAGVIFVLRILLSGQEQFYKTAIPVGMGCLYFAEVAVELHARGEYLFTSWRYVVLSWVLYLALLILYKRYTSNKSGRRCVLVMIFGAVLAVLTYDLVCAYDGRLTREFLFKLSNVLMLASMTTIPFAMRVHNDGKYHRTWGDRSDGRRIRTLSPISIVGNYIMPNRNGASNQMRDTIEITNIERYIHKKRREGMESFGITHVFLAAYVRCVSQYPGCNRFLSGQRVYSRGDDIQFCMVIKKAMTTDAPDTIIKLHLKPTDTSKEVYDKFNAAVEEVHNTPLDSTFDNTAKYLTYLPGVTLKFAIWFLKTLDYFGLLPKFLLEVSPFHASIFFTSMGSLGIPPIFHHLYDFGNMPAFCAFGCKRREQEISPEGEVVTKKYVDYTFNLDERTVDGFYYATVMKYLRRLLRNPDRLDTPPETVVQDID